MNKMNISTNADAVDNYFAFPPRRSKGTYRKALGGRRMSAAAVDEVRAAIAALSNPQETQTANQWLVALERSVEGWAAAEQLLREPAGSQCRFFGAKFLYSKVQRDSVQLNEGTVPALVHSIVQHILRVAGEAVLDLNVCRYLCLALAALAVQMNQEGIVPQILLWFNPIVASKPRVLLELLVVLPEECYNRQVDVSIDVRDKFAEQLSASIGDVLGFLHVLVTQNVSVNVGVQTEGTTNLILRCLTKWIDHISFSGPLLSTHPLFMYALECLGQEAAFEAATEVVIATLAKFRCREPAVLSLVIPRVLALRDLWASQVHRLTEDSDTEDMNVCRCLCRLFTEAAESCLDVIKDDGRTDLDPLVFQLVECVRFPYDHSIARIPLVFFMEADNMQLSDFMRASAKLHERFITAYVGLYDAALVQLVLPADVIQGFGVSMPDEVVDARIDWKNTVLDCCVVLGPATCVQRACMVLQDQIQAIQARAPSNGGASLAASMGTASQWGRIEAALFSIQTVPSHDNPLFPQLLSLIGSLPSDLRALRTTIIGLFGGLSSWLSRNDNFLPPILAQLYSTLQEGDAPIAAAAAKAIMRIFMASAGVVSLPSTDLHNIMLSMRRAQKLTLDADLMLLEGFCVVVSKLPTEDSKEASFACIVEPIAVALANNVAQAPPPAPSVIAADIDRLTTCFRFVLMDGAVVAKMFAQVQPLLVKVLDAYPGKESLCEKICRCYKHSIRSCRTGFIQILPAMTAHLAEQFRKTPVAAFLYAGAICFSDFAREDNGAHIQLLYTMVRFSTLLRIA